MSLVKKQKTLYSVINDATYQAYQIIKPENFGGSWGALCQEPPAVEETLPYVRGKFFDSERSTKYDSRDKIRESCSGVTAFQLP